MTIFPDLLDNYLYFASIPLSIMIFIRKHLVDPIREHIALRNWYIEQTLQGLQKNDHVYFSNKVSLSKKQCK